MYSVHVLSINGSPKNSSTERLQAQVLKKIMQNGVNCGIA